PGNVAARDVGELRGHPDDAGPDIGVDRVHTARPRPDQNVLRAALRIGKLADLNHVRSSCLSDECSLHDAVPSGFGCQSVRASSCGVSDLTTPPDAVRYGS